jgi:hypothetical protein
MNRRKFIKSLSIFLGAITGGALSARSAQKEFDTWKTVHVDYDVLERKGYLARAYPEYLPTTFGKSESRSLRRALIEKTKELECIVDVNPPKGGICFSIGYPDRCEGWFGEKFPVGTKIIWPIGRSEEVPPCWKVVHENSGALICLRPLRIGGKNHDLVKGLLNASSS